MKTFIILRSHLKSITPLKTTKTLLSSKNFTEWWYFAGMSSIFHQGSLLWNLHEGWNCSSLLLMVGSLLVRKPISQTTQKMQAKISAVFRKNNNNCKTGNTGEWSQEEAGVESKARSPPSCRLSPKQVVNQSRVKKSRKKVSIMVVDRVSDFLN